MTRILDISLPVHSEMPVWPGSPAVEVRRIKTIESDLVTVTRLSCDVHTGTHIDAPLHFLPNGQSVTELSLEALVGPASVRHVRGVREITSGELNVLRLPAGARRLLLRTDNSDWWLQGVREFRDSFVALTADAADWIVARGLWLVGIDYLSIQLFRDPEPTTHCTLLSRGVVIVEGLDLSAVSEGEYQLVCLPLRLEGAEGAMARAILLDEHSLIAADAQA